jgi:hypothetical protein
MPWGRSQKSKALVARFVAATNAHDIAAMRELVSDDFTYIDSWREGVSGRDTVMLGVERLFAADPGFRIEVESVSFADPFVLMRGWANSSVPAFGRRRAVWRARCEGGSISEWQSWAEGGPPAMNRTYSPEATRDMSERAGAPPTAA